MIIKINNIPWIVKMVKRDNKNMNPTTDEMYLGLCNYEASTIRIRKGMTKEVTRQTLIHELVHAFLFSHGISVNGDEAMCDFIGSHADSIIKIANEIMERWW